MSAALLALLAAEGLTVTEAAAEYAPSVSPVHGVGKTAPTATVTVTEAEIAKEFGVRI